MGQRMPWLPGYQCSAGFVAGRAREGRQRFLYCGAWHESVGVSRNIEKACGSGMLCWKRGAGKMEAICISVCACHEYK
jgi:hypothetical protein